MDVNAGVHISTGSNSTTISDNKIVSNIGCGVLIHDQKMLTTPTSPISGTTISNNSMEVGGGFFPVGVIIIGASDSQITANNITGGSYGTWLSGKDANFTFGPGGESPELVPYPSDYNVVSNNFISGEFYGIYADKSNNNIVSDNNLTSLYLKECSNTTLRNNALSNFGLEGSDILHFLNDIDASNTVEGKPVYYLINESNLLINPFTYPNIGYLGIVNSRNITLGRLIFANKIQGLMLAQVTNCEMSEISLANCQVGIYLWNCSKITMMGSAISECPTGLEMRLCRNSIIRGNTFLHSALRLVNSSDNTFHRNNFIARTKSVQIQIIDSVNRWDDGDSPPGPFDCPICVDKRPVGNYWSDYQGQDDGSHTQPHNCPGDSIGDTELPVHGVDYCPLMKPWTPLVGDLDYNGIVDIVDLHRAARNWHKTSP